MTGAKNVRPSASKKKNGPKWIPLLSHSKSYPDKVIDSTSVPVVRNDHPVFKRARAQHFVTLEGLRKLVSDRYTVTNGSTFCEITSPALSCLSIIFFAITTPYLLLFPKSNLNFWRPRPSTLIAASSNSRPHSVRISRHSGLAEKNKNSDVIKNICQAIFWFRSVMKRY